MEILRVHVCQLLIKSNSVCMYRACTTPYLLGMLKAFIYKNTINTFIN